MIDTMISTTSIHVFQLYFQKVDVVYYQNVIGWWLSPMNRPNNFQFIWDPTLIFGVYNCASDISSVIDYIQ